MPGRSRPQLASAIEFSSLWVAVLRFAHCYSLYSPFCLPDFWRSALRFFKFSRKAFARAFICSFCTFLSDISLIKLAILGRNYRQLARDIPEKLYYLPQVIRIRAAVAQW